ncbi:MAG: alpha/beta hydrolase [Pirellulales bacterium]|jgi:acetyl esterase|nr:alpha/beta hydrolase [Pirellulales bacterium]HJN66426.1 alpha/beta hydrolase [Pirellulales bacterium]
MTDSPIDRVDPQLRKVLKLVNSPAFVPFHQLSPEEAREQVGRMFTIPVNITVAREQDLFVPTAAGPLRCRLYHPDPERRLPLLIYYHGGGWVLGGLEEVHSQTVALAARSGCAVLSVDYRLAPEHPFPAAVEDAYAALLWASESADVLQIDRAKICVAGDSAGGNLAAATTILARDRGGVKIAFQLLLYPATDAACQTASMDRFGKGLLLEKEDMLWFWDHYCPDRSLREADVRASPLRVADAAGLPPAYLLLAEFDPLLDEGLAYAERLEVAGVATICRVVPAAIHGFIGFWQLCELADRELSLVAEALAGELCPPI